MSETLTKEAVDGISKQLSETVALIKQMQDRAEADKQGMKAQIEQLVKDAIAASAAAPRKIEFATAGAFGKAANLVAKLPSEVQTKLDNAFLLSKILNQPVQNLKYWDEVKSDMGEIHKALSDSSAKGAEWVPDDFSNQLYEFVRLEAKVSSLFPQVNMPTPSYILPVQIGRMQTYKHPEQTANTGQTLTTLGDPTNYTGNVTLTAVDHVGAVLLSKNITEDSIIDLMPQVQRDIIAGLAEGRDDAILNGDSQSTHEDADIGAGSADSRRRLWLGLRAMANDNSYKTDLGTFTGTTVHNIRGQMGRYGVSTSRLVWIVGIQTYIKMVNLELVQTVDKYGPNATVITGELGKFFGIPVIVSEWIREDLNASGVNDGVTTDNTVLHLVNRDCFAVGVRRQADIQILRELYARSRQDAIQVTERVAFSPIHPIASNKTTWMGYNIAV